MNLYATTLQADERVQHALAEKRVAWLQVVRGAVQLNDQSLTAGDGAAIVDESQIILQGASDESEVLLFEMAA